MNLSLRFIQSIEFLEYEPFAIPASAYDAQAALLTHLRLCRVLLSLPTRQVTFRHILCCGELEAGFLVQPGDRRVRMEKLCRGIATIR